VSRRPPGSGSRFAARVRRQAALLGLGASALVGLLWAAGLLDELEGVAVDRMMRVRGERPGDERIAIVAIDARSIDRYGRWPWRRDLFAELVSRLAAAGARTIALDVVFAEPSRRDEVVDLSSEDEALARAVDEAGSVVLGYFFRRTGDESADGSRPPPDALPPMPPVQRVTGDVAASVVPRRPLVEPNLPRFAEAAAGQGFYDQRPEAGVHRRYALIARHRGFHFPALSLAAAAHHLGEPVEVRFSGSLPEVRLGERAVTTDEAGKLWIDYAGPGGSFETISASRVLAPGGLAPGELAGRLVFVGFTEGGLGEVFTSPWGTEMTGVEVHAHAADNLLAGRYIRDTGVEAAASLAAILLLGPLSSLLVVATPGRLAGALAAVAAVLLWPAAALLAFTAGGWHLDVTAPVLAGLLALVGQVAAGGQSRWIQRTFRQFVSREVVDEMLRHPERVQLGGESRELTVLFCDVRGFTALSESREPRQVVEILNRFFTPMTAVVLAHGGTLDKYMGDALMAFFGAPTRQEDHAARACRAALAMRGELERVKAEAAADGGDGAIGPLPERFGVGIGLNTGVMTVGNMGSEQVFDYTVIGDPVNLGSRIEGLTRVYGVDVVVSDFTRRAVEAAGGEDLVFRELDRVRVKGRREPVTVYELIGRREAVTAEELARVERYERALAAYRERRFGEAAAALERLLADHPGDGPAKALLVRAAELAHQPPPVDWEPVLERTSK